MRGACKAATDLRPFKSGRTRESTGWIDLLSPTDLRFVAMKEVPGCFVRILAPHNDAIKWGGKENTLETD